jgi:hypothetical protein
VIKLHLGQSARIPYSTKLGEIGTEAKLDEIGTEAKLDEIEGQK